MATGKSDQNEPITIAAVGDIMLGDSPQSFGFGVGSKIRTEGALFPFAHVASELKDHDVTVGNLEVPISRFDPLRAPFESQIYRAQPECIDGLVAAGFDLVSLCTNHSMQHGRVAMEEQRQLLGSRGIGFFGIDQPDQGIANLSVLERRGLRLGFLAYNSRPEQYFLDVPQWRKPDELFIREGLELARASADVVIVSMHWGDEFVNVPSPDQVGMARRLINAGADIILGHHSHTLQGIERHGRGVIAYSLGNFVFDHWQQRLRRTMILRILVRERNRFEWEVLPVRINSNWQPEIVRDRRGEQDLELIESISARIGTVSPSDYAREVRRGFREYRRDVLSHYVRNAYRYPTRALIQNLAGAIRRRLR